MGIDRMWRIIGMLVATCCFAVTSARAQDAPTRDEAAFAQYVGERIEKSGGIRSDSEGRLSLQLSSVAGEYLLTAYLDRIWGACQRAQEQCSGFIDEYVSGVLSLITERTRPPESASLRLVVRPTAYLSSVERDLKAEPLITYPFVGDLSIALVIDSPRSLTMAQRKDLEKLKLSETEAFDIGKANLKSELQPLAAVLKTIQGKSIGYLEENAYEPSRLIFHDEWAEYARQIGGSLIVAVPATNILIYGSGATAEAVDALRGLALNVGRKSQRPLSPLVFRWTERGWQVAP